ncbi:hypothetical protein L596_019255 [Steinernema carpocapsae]|uniref:Uncharacterized protein n=1 Tax=Steinernema carpocapsae TaxID=34508 RepID=A0A4U5MQ29_STECR|nr:hypothetical protein L596_019255 [Steinernema carpocapsae]
METAPIRNALEDIGMGNMKLRDSRLSAMEAALAAYDYDKFKEEALKVRGAGYQTKEVNIVDTLIREKIVEWCAVGLEPDTFGQLLAFALKTAKDDQIMLQI